MNSHDLEQLAGRLAALEAFNRRLSRLVVVLLVVLASVVWMGQRAPAKKKAPAGPATAKVLEAEAFLLKNASGQVIASLGAAPNAGPTLRLLGPNGTERAAMALDNTGTPHLALHAPNGKTAYSVALDKDGYPAVEIGAPDAAKLMLVVGAGGPGIGLLDAGGTVRMGLDLKTEGPVLAFSTKDKTDQVTISGTDKGPSVALTDPDGHPRITFTVRSDQSVFGIRDVKGEVRVGLEVRADNPALGLYGPNGKAIFVKP